jgi:hypothetical protein
VHSPRSLRLYSAFVALSSLLPACGGSHDKASTIDADGDSFAPVDGDCDDADPEVHPGADEVWYDGIDQDCDGASDFDQDQDGQESWRREGGTDCWDDSAVVPPGFETLNGFVPAIEAEDVYLGAPERWYDGVNGDCAGDDDFDADLDGVRTDRHPSDGIAEFGEDCNDQDDTVFPGAEELCDGQDNDCDAVLPTDESDDDGDGAVECAEDAGGWDGLGSPDFDDCDDFDASTRPGVEELCDGLDNDCDGAVSAGELDADSDGFVACEEDDGGWDDPPRPDFGDCDDYDATVHPGAEELCDGQDGNCDGVLSAEETDDDEDGFVECLEDEGGWDHADPPGFGDCDDADANISPEVSLVCGEHSLSEAQAKLIGESPGDYAGRSVAGAGDVNNDGFADLLVGASGEDSGGSKAGAAYLVHGPVSGQLSLGSAAAKLIGELANDHSGDAVTGAGDVNDDGFDDLFIGAYGAGDQNVGMAYLVLGPVTGELSLSEATAKFSGESGGDIAGGSISSAGDVNDDGHDDLLFGVPEEDSGGRAAGAAYLVLGPVTGSVDLGGVDAKLIGESVADYAGGSVAGVGDTNGDGYGDLLVGAHGSNAAASDAGAAYLVLGPISGQHSLSIAAAKLLGEEFEDFAGWTVSAAGDVDDDGFADVLVGALGAGSYAGASYLVLGPVSGTLGLGSADARLTGEVAYDHSADAISMAGDVNDDGYDDLILGAYLADGADRYAGVVYVAYGPLVGEISLGEAQARLTGEAAGDYAGHSVAAAGDLDGDGYGDLVVGSDLENSGGEDAGAAYVVLGGSAVP